jgi:hypothetical protein
MQRNGVAHNHRVAYTGSMQRGTDCVKKGHAVNKSQKVYTVYTY